MEHAGSQLRGEYAQASTRRKRRVVSDATSASATASQRSGSSEPCLDLSDEVTDKRHVLEESASRVPVILV